MDKKFRYVAYAFWIISVILAGVIGPFYPPNMFVVATLSFIIIGGIESRFEANRKGEEA